MLDFVHKKVLITTHNWFYAPDGKQYRAVHGTLKAIHEAGKTLGFIPNRSHANWFVEIGNMVIMGCQVMYIVQAENVEHSPIIPDMKREDDGTIKNIQEPNRIYFTT